MLEIPEVELNSTFPHTINGFLPFQVEVYNKLKNLNAGLMYMDTGTGKSCVTIGLLKYHLLKDEFDVAIIVVKAHNKINFQRSLKEIGGLDSLIIDGTATQRKKFYQQALNTSPIILITNYEKFRVDYEQWKLIFQKRLLIFWDEAPTKLKHRNTKLYNRIRYLLYKKSLKEKRPKSLRQYALTATPIENSPVDFYNVIRLLEPEVLGSVTDFNNRYVAYFNPYSSQPAAYRNLAELGQRTEHMTARVSKNDPEIAKQFPRVRETEIVIDWDQQDYEIYKKLSKKSYEIFQGDGYESILPLITLMQMMCDMPSIINRSARQYQQYESLLQEQLDDFGKLPAQMGSAYAKQFTEYVGNLYDDHHTKIDTLRELLVEKYPNEKILIFSSFNNALLPYLSIALTDWQVPHVIYSGTQKQKQKAEDSFRSGDARVFLSSDAGSDSINLQQASIVIHYDLPLKFSTYLQRSNRAHRITSEHPSVIYYTLMMADSIDMRKHQIIKRKSKYEKDIFSNISQEIKNDPKELEYILFGD